MADTLDPTTKDKVLAVWRDELGLTPAQLAGVSRNINRESGWNPAEWGDNQTSRGLYQHHGPRLAALQQFAGENYLDPVEQTRFAIHEMKTSEGKALSALKSASTSDEAEKAFRVYFERPAGTAVGKGVPGTVPGSTSGSSMLAALLGAPRGFSEAVSAPSSPLPASGSFSPITGTSAPLPAPTAQKAPPQPPAPRRLALGRAIHTPAPILSGRTPNLSGAYQRALNAILARRSANPFA